MADDVRQPGGALTSTWRGGEDYLRPAIADVGILRALTQGGGAGSVPRSSGFSGDHGSI